jgi:hypothetical protein
LAVPGSVCLCPGAYFFAVPGSVCDCPGAYCELPGDDGGVPFLVCAMVLSGVVSMARIAARAAMHFIVVLHYLPHNGAKGSLRKTMAL